MKLFFIKNILEILWYEAICSPPPSSLHTLEGWIYNFIFFFMKRKPVYIPLKWQIIMWLFCLFLKAKFLSAIWIIKVNGAVSWWSFFYSFCGIMKPNCSNMQTLYIWIASQMRSMAHELNVELSIQKENTRELNMYMYIYIVLHAPNQCIHNVKSNSSTAKRRGSIKAWGYQNRTPKCWI